MASEAMQLVANAQSEEELGGVLEEFQAKANSAFTNLQALSTQEATLVTNINGYCGAEAPAEAPAE